MSNSSGGDNNESETLGSMDGHVPADEAADVADGEPRAGWVHEGGVLRWDEPDGSGEPARVDLRAEARSMWAADDLDLPLGTPAPVRLRGVRAWLARQRLLEDEAQGMLLLERRQLGQADDAGSSFAEQGDDPLALALVEHQAAAAEFEAQLEMLSDIESHSGQGQALVEFYLWLSERLAALAVAPAAPADFAPGILLAQDASDVQRAGDARARAEWTGHAGSVQAARRRVEQVSAPEPED